MLGCNVTAKARIVTGHASDRMKQRTSFSEEQLYFWLQHQLYVDLGEKPGIHKKHLLFYSPVDEDYYIIIQDRYTGDIITVLTLEYHRNLAWSICETAKYQAKFRLAEFFTGLVQRFSQIQHVVIEPPLQHSVIPQTEILHVMDQIPSDVIAQRIFVSAIFLDSEGNRKVKQLFKDKILKSDLVLMQWLQSHGFLGQLHEGLQQLPVSDFLGVSIRWGNKGVPQFFSVDELAIMS